MIRRSGSEREQWLVGQVAPVSESMPCHAALLLQLCRLPPAAGQLIADRSTRHAAQHAAILPIHPPPQLLHRPHYLLATLLLCNAAAMEALPIFLDRLLNPVAAVVISGWFRGRQGRWPRGLSLRWDEHQRSCEKRRWSA